jgi:hypothetical protein
LSIIHFQGKFVFQMPEYNNNPANDVMTDSNARFDSSLHEENVYEICGCDPAHYFEFTFRSVNVNQVTYHDGSTAVEGDSVLGQRIRLNGIMTDVSPSAVGAQLFAATMKVGNLLSGKLHKAVQSDLRTNIRPLDSTDPFDQENVGAHFETIIDLTDKTSPEGSRFLRELGDVTQLEFYMHTNRYTIWNTESGYPNDRLNGGVYGYIRPIQPMIDNKGTRIKGRRLIAHPDIKATSERIARAFLGTTPLTRNTDIDGTYDISKTNYLLSIRYLDFIPQLDRDHNTPTDKGVIKEYIIFFIDKHAAKDGHIEIGRFKGSYDEMKLTGGICAFKIPVEVLSRCDDMIVEIEAVQDDEERIPLMIESEWDCILESERGLTLASGDTTEVIARVYQRNRPAYNCPVRLLVQPNGEKFFYRRRNRRSPIVAKWKEDQGQLISDLNGKVKATVEAIDLENSNEIFDPVNNKYVQGELDWDRYYGNYIYMEINNDLRRFQYRAVEQIEIPVRVLHVVKNLNSISPKEITFKDYIFPKLLKYYVRYFPWLHTFERADETYVQFLNFENYDEVRNTITEIIRRLSLDNNEWNKMPRSRDFPIGGVELIVRWLVAGMPK